MKAYKKKTWKHEITGVDGNTMLFGVNIFDYQWKNTGKSVRINDPLYNREYNFTIYSTEINGVNEIFAAGEFSNCIWGFYVEKY